MPYKDPEKQRAYQKEYRKKWYAENKRSHLDRVHRNTRIYVKKMKKWASDYKAAKGCTKCPENDPVCLDFHHAGDDKEMDISLAIRRAWSQKRLQKEIDKCIVICANCHRKHHASVTQSG